MFITFSYDSKLYNPRSKTINVSTHFHCHCHPHCHVTPSLTHVIPCSPALLSAVVSHAGTRSHLLLWDSCWLPHRQRNIRCHQGIGVVFSCICSRLLLDLSSHNLYKDCNITVAIDFIIAHVVAIYIAIGIAILLLALALLLILLSALLSCYWHWHPHCYQHWHYHVEITQ